MKKTHYLKYVLAVITVLSLNFQSI